MSSEKIKKYIKRAREKGIDDQKIKNQLLEAGWERSKVENSFSALDENDKDAVEKDSKVMDGADQKEDVEAQKEWISKSEPSFDRKSSKLLPVVVVLILIGFVGFLAASVLFSEEPQDQIMEAAHNMTDLDSLSTELTAELMAREDGGESFDGEFTILARVDEPNEEMEFGIDGQALVGGMGGSFEGGIFLVNDKLFGRLDQFPDLGMLLPVDTSLIRGQNILLTDQFSEEIEDGLEEEVGQTPFEEEIANIFDEDVDPEIAEQFLDDILSGIWDKEILVVGESEEDEIAGVEVDRYNLEVDIKNLPDLILELAEDYEEYIDDLSAEELKAEMEEEEDEFDEIKEAFDEIDLYLSVWTDGEYIYRVQMVIDEIEEEMEELSDFRMLLDVEFSGFNEPLNLDEPDDYTEIEDLMEDLMGPTQLDPYQDPMDPYEGMDPYEDEDPMDPYEMDEEYNL